MNGSWSVRNRTAPDHPEYWSDVQGPSTAYLYSSQLFTAISSGAMVEMTAGLMYYDMEIAPMVYVLTVLIALVSAVLASLMSARRITKEKLVDAIRERGAV